MAESRRINGALSEAATKRGMRLSIYEGMAFALMVGLGEVFFLADAIRLSASRLEQGLVVALPLFVGSLGPLLALRVLGRMRSRKPLVFAATLGQALTLFVLAAADGMGWATPRTLIAGAVAYGFFGQMGGTAWSSWFGDLVPATVRGRYFAIRNRGIYVLTFLGLFAGGLLLNHFETGVPAEAARSGGAGFALVLALAGGFRLVSAALHLLIPEPGFVGLSTRVHVLRFLRTERGTGLWRVLVLCAAFYFTVYLASPYFAPFMLEELRFSYLEYMVASVIVIALKVLFLPLWGRTIDQLGARAVFLLAGVGTAIIPLPYLWAQGLGWVLVAQGFSGLSWAGYDLSLFSLLLERSYKRVRPHVFATQSVLNGTAQLLGTLAGAALVGLGSMDLRVLFGVSLGGRLVLMLWMPRLLGRSGVDQPVRRLEVLFRVIGFRTAGGLALRPLPQPSKTPEDDRAASLSQEPQA